MAEALGGAELVAVSNVDGEPGDKARFVRPVERALLDGEADLGVHSAKDVPGEMADELALVGVPGREDPADAFVGAARSLEELPEGARVGTASLRRRSQLLALRPDLDVVELRGNVDTRLAEARRRRGRRHRPGRGGPAPPRTAPRRSRSASAPTRWSRRRTGVAGAPGPRRGCRRGSRRGTDQRPRGAGGAHRRAGGDDRARGELRDAARHLRPPHGATLAVAGFAGLPDGSEWVRDALRGDPEQPAALGEALAERMLAAGAGEILERAAAWEPA